MKIRDPILLEIMLILYVIFFVALFFESRWFIDPDNAQMDTMIGSVWTIAISGFLIGFLTIRQWKTKRPLPITWMGLGLGLQALGASVFSFELLLGSYLHTKIVALLWTAGFAIFVGFICVGMQLVSARKQA